MLTACVCAHLFLARTDSFHPCLCVLCAQSNVRAQHTEFGLCVARAHPQVPPGASQQRTPRSCVCAHTQLRAHTHRNGWVLPAKLFRHRPHESGALPLRVAFLEHVVRLCVNPNENRSMATCTMLDCGA
jgi:hypothetical protein